jgi:hypothetical protein
LFGEVGHSQVRLIKKLEANATRLWNAGARKFQSKLCLAR